MKKLGEVVRSIEMPGLLWSTYVQSFINFSPSKFHKLFSHSFSKLTILLLLSLLFSYKFVKLCITRRRSE
ncbi:hypothetical protein VIGAN_07081500, partial [Vigna angularis var. angularis]